MIEVRFIFKGHVQGVGFRYTVCQFANKYSILGWVKNLSDGAVEMLAQGTQKDIDECCRSIENYFIDNISDVKKTIGEVIDSHVEFKIEY